MALFEFLKEPATEGLVLVKGGCFEMGDIFGDGANDEKPAHEVFVDDFYIGKYPVTQRQWVKMMGSNPSRFKGCDDCPVEQISWDDAQEFISRLNGKTGKNYRLPTEAEWEYAARSGGRKEKFAGTSNASELGNYAWFDGISGIKTNPTGKKKPNGLDLFDMSGNVWEWVNDWYDEGYYSNSPKDNPKGPSGGQYRVLRGGSWFFPPAYCRASRRYRDEPGVRAGHIGFRLAMSLK